jgi:hypothetical protein
MDNDIQAGTVLAVPPKCAVRDNVMDQLPNVLIRSKNNAGNAARIKTIETMTKRFWTVSLVLLT